MRIQLIDYFAEIGRRRRRLDLGLTGQELSQWLQEDVGEDLVPGGGFAEEPTAAVAALGL